MRACKLLARLTSPLAMTTPGGRPARSRVPRPFRPPHAARPACRSRPRRLRRKARSNMRDDGRQSFATGGRPAWPERPGLHRLRRRRAAPRFSGSGGFHPRFGVGGEETLLSIDLAARGWGLAYCDDVTAVHHPEPGAARPGRRARLVRNRLWTAWLRFSAGAAWTATTRTAHAALSDGGVRAGFCDAVRGMPWVLRERLPVDPSLDRDLGRVLACP